MIRGGFEGSYDLSCSDFDARKPGSRTPSLRSSTSRSDLSFGQERPEIYCQVARIPDVESDIMTQETRRWFRWS